MKFDVFISHAYEDKDSVARPLAATLRRAGVCVWYDEFSLQLGDSLSESIDAGLAESRFGVIILSKHFLTKAWPQRELRGLVARELSAGVKVLLPVWHGISRADVVAVSPPLADVLAVSTSEGIDYVARKILEVVRPDLNSASASSGRGADEPNSRGRISSASVIPLDGDYLVYGRDPDGSPYRGHATVKGSEGVVVIASTIGARTYICQGRCNHDTVTVYGDFEVEYVVKDDGSLVGNWRKGGIETLLPIQKAR
jgi:hypothetical protein